MEPIVKSGWASICLKCSNSEWSEMRCFNAIAFQIDFSYAIDHRAGCVSQGATRLPASACVQEGQVAISRPIHT